MRNTEEIITAHGGGGSATQELLDTVILPPLRNIHLESLTDSAIVPVNGGNLCFTTDGYVVKPIIFPGGTIGDLAICGTVNDLAVMGAEPLAISLALILDEGLPIETLKIVMGSIAASAQKAGVKVVTGDTKVIESRGEPGMTITTAGIGELKVAQAWSFERIEPGDVVLINGLIAEHGLAIMASREDMQLTTRLISDVTPLNHLLKKLREEKIEIKFARDCTRGGLAGVVADIAVERQLSIVVAEDAIPLSATARHTAELLGLDPMNVANEGKVLLVIPERDADRALEICRSMTEGEKAAVIGAITDDKPALAELKTRGGGRRIIQKPYGEDLPRIC